MSWLYSILFTGLFMASSGDATVNKAAEVNAPQAVIASSADESDTLDKTYPFTANGRVSVSNVNGSITVEAWDRNEIRLVATKTADSKEALEDVDINVDARADSFRVEAEYKDWRWNGSDKERHRKLEVEFKLWVPRTAVLNEVETVNGSVTVSNFVNTTKISAVNGNVNASNLRGAANLSTVNGEVLADFDRLETGSRISLSTVNGGVKLTIPSDSNATIKADSLNGNISNDFGLPVRKGEYVGRDLYGKVGSGEVQIKLNSVNGPLAINRKNDGKSLNAPTNLLPAKGKSGDWDNDDSINVDPDINVNIDTDKMNRDITRAMRNAEKASADAAKAGVKVAENLKLKELNDIKVKIDMKDMEVKLKNDMRIHMNDMSKMRDAMWMGSNPVVERKTNSFAVKGSSKVTIDANNCNVKVRGWDKPEVKYVLTELAGRRNGSPATITEENTSSGVSLKVSAGDRPRGWFGEDGSGVRLEVFVPRKSDLKITSDGEIRLEGVTGEIDLVGGDEAIDVRGSEGKLNVTNADGSVRVVGFKGELTATTGAGDVYLDGDFSQINGKAEDGNFVLTLPANINADIEAPEGERFMIEDLPGNKKVSDNHWRFGAGGRKYNFTSSEGFLTVQNRDLVASEK